jgi:hypothetical protein
MPSRYSTTSNAAAVLHCVSRWIAVGDHIMRVSQSIVAAVLLCSVGRASAEYVEIWEYAFVARTVEPVAGHGASIFKPSEHGMEGPMWSQESLPYRLEFSVSGNEAHAQLTSTKGRNIAVTLEGTVTRKSNAEGCLTRVVLNGETEFILLERLTSSMCET